MSAILLAIAMFFAQGALSNEPQTWAPEFSEPLIAECVPVVTLEFIGCTVEDCYLGDCETDFAGVKLLCSDIDTALVGTPDGMTSEDPPVGAGPQCEAHWTVGP